MAFRVLDFGGRMKIIGIVPARYDSKRFPGKVLADILGKPLIQRVYEQAKKVELLHDVVIATDSEEIFKVVENFEGKAIMTSSNCKSGTDRLAEVATGLVADIFVNIQGDEPLISPEVISKVAQALIEDKTIDIATVARKITTQEELNNPNVVKVVIDNNGFALYFSRAQIPYVRHPLELKSLSFVSYKHIGLYAYRREFLLNFVRMEQGLLEKVEHLEQLRALENGYKIKVVITQYDSIGVDTQEDLEKVRKILKNSE
ncbi:MAG: 3-deoxy-manno-octulosonate cytidylyltransferase [bacterium]